MTEPGPDGRVTSPWIPKQHILQAMQSEPASHSVTVRPSTSKPLQPTQPCVPTPSAILSPVMKTGLPSAPRVWPPSGRRLPARDLFQEQAREAVSFCRDSVLPPIQWWEKLIDFVSPMGVACELVGTKSEDQSCNWSVRFWSAGRFGAALELKVDEGWHLSFHSVDSDGRRAAIYIAPSFYLKTWLDWWNVFRRMIPNTRIYHGCYRRR